MKHIVVKHVKPLERENKGGGGARPRLVRVMVRGPCLSEEALKLHSHVHDILHHHVLSAQSRCRLRGRRPPLSPGSIRNLQKQTKTPKCLTRAQASLRRLTGATIPHRERPGQVVLLGRGTQWARTTRLSCHCWTRTSACARLLARQSRKRSWAGPGRNDRFRRRTRGQWPCLFCFVRRHTHQFNFDA
jgi:hypothetical protein